MRNKYASQRKGRGSQLTVWREHLSWQGAVYHGNCNDGTYMTLLGPRPPPIRPSQFSESVPFHSDRWINVVWIETRQSWKKPSASGFVSNPPPRPCHVSLLCVTCLFCTSTLLPRASDTWNQETDNEIELCSVADEHWSETGKNSCSKSFKIIFSSTGLTFW